MQKGNTLADSMAAEKEAVANTRWFYFRKLVECARKREEARTEECFGCELLCATTFRNAPWAGFCAVLCECLGDPGGVPRGLRKEV